MSQEVGSGAGSASVMKMLLSSGRLKTNGGGLRRQDPSSCRIGKKI